MKFDFVIGNPPYQGDNHKQLYPDFYLEAQKCADNVEMIFPTGWQAPKNALNLQKMNTVDVKEDKQIVFINNISNAFPSVSGVGETNIILWKRNYDNQNNGKQLIYTNGKDPELKKLVCNKAEILTTLPEIFQRITNHFTNDEKHNLSSIVCSGRSVLKFNDEFIKKYPDSPEKRLQAIQVKQPHTTKLGPNEEYELKTATFDVLDYVFLKEDPHSDNYYKLYGSSNNKRAERWIEKKYMTPRYKEENNVAYYKVLIAEAASAGDFGAKLSETIIAGPNESSTPTFIGIGCFMSRIEAMNCSKYIKTKLFRALLGALKTTRHNPASVFSFIPLQDFSDKSDIDWSQTIKEIDSQLYKKYNLSEEEIEFIENNVKEMN